jgi:hypothetical protein
MIRKFVEEEYHLYDAVSIAEDNTLTEADIRVSYKIRSRLSGEGLRGLLAARTSIETALSCVPADLDLTSAEVPWDDVRWLLDCFCEVRGVHLAVATKILFKKRPRLIPIIDSVIQEHYRSSPQIDGLESDPPSEGVGIMRLFRDDLLSCQGRIGQLAAALSDDGKPLTPVRILEALVWMEVEGSRYPIMRAHALGEAGTSPKPPSSRATDTLRAPSTGQDANRTNNRAMLVASRGHRCYHLPDCGQALRIHKEYRQTYASIEDAMRSMYPPREPGGCCAHRIRELVGRGTLR